jgi:tetratricopeptide (TPR) repeat protein
MSWLEYHSDSEKFASLADSALKKGDIGEAVKYYKEAAKAEEQAISFLDLSKKRTLGITVISTAALYFKGKEFEKAELIVHKWLGSDKLPEFATNQLQKILQTIWNEKSFQKAGVEFTKGTVLISVSGGMIVLGGAPLDLIHRKVDEVKNIFYRIIEMQLKRPFRKKGVPPSEIQEQFRPWLFQAAPGSYQFAVRIQKPAQLSVFPDEEPEIEEVTGKFFEVLEASAKESHEELIKIIPNEDYRDSFLKLTRNLAPTGKSFEKLEIKSAIDKDFIPITFIPESRKALNKTLHATKKKSEKDIKLTEKQLSGILRALHLDKDWIEINISKEFDAIRIYQTGDVIDDIVGPMVNQKVLVDVLVTPEGKYIFQDIQSDE